jgi:hypothetical protein
MTTKLAGIYEQYEILLYSIQYLTTQPKRSATKFVDP